MIYINKYKSHIFLFLIILFGFVIRVYSLSNVPNGFHADEAAFGYNAYSILQTGKDEYGKSFPIVLKSFGDYKGALYAYSDVPFIATLGLNPFAVRLPSVIFSTFSIFLLFILVDKLTKNKKIALISSFLLAISPWDITISRVTGDVILGVFFCLLLSIFLTKLYENNSLKWLFFSILSGLMAMLSYAPFRFYVVILSFIFLLFSVNKVKNKFIFNKKIALVILSFIALGIFYSLVGSIERFNQLSIFSNPQTKLVMEEQIREDKLTPVFITRAFHNKIINYGRTILFNAQQYFTLDFLALNGGYPQRERIPGVGLFYLWEIPFLLIGIYLILKTKNKRGLIFIFWWILLLIPVFLTFDEIPNVHRTLIILPAICVIIALGINETLNYKILNKSKIYKSVVLIFLVLVIYESSYFLHQYYVHQEKHQSWYRGEAYKELIPQIEKYYTNYKKIVITKSNGSPYIYILFLGKYDPAKYQKEGSPRDLDYKGFDKYYFVPHDCPLGAQLDEKGLAKGSQGFLYINKGSCKTPANGKLLKTIFWGDGSPAFKIIEYLPK